jgi:hypothetical protein
MIKKFLTFILLTLGLWITPTNAQTDTAYLSETVEDYALNWQSCFIPEPAEAITEGKFISSNYKAKLSPGERFKIKLYILNTGNTTWFGDNSLCENKPFFRLGASHEKDRSSVLWENLIQFQNTFPEQSIDHNWLSRNRIKMQQAYVPPGQVATFIFEAVAPMESDIYREYFTPLFEGSYWYDAIEIPLTLYVGETTDEMREKLFFMTSSTPSQALDLNQRNVIIDLSEQKLYARIGEKNIFVFPVSSGKPATPTPVVSTKVLFKQKVRVAGKAPHYIMPLYQAFWGGGSFGIHALPSLANDGGIFWREALNHIGEKRSHGCVRLLPWDAETFWEFTETGTPIEVVW